MCNLYSVFNELNQLQEAADIAALPDELKELVARGVPVFTEEPEFIEEETDALTEAVKFAALDGHYEDHVNMGKQNLWNLKNKADRYSYTFSDISKDEYFSMAEDLANAEIDGTNVKAFICQVTRKENGNHSATKKYSTGESRRDLNTMYRICKYRLNPNIKIPVKNLYYEDPNTYRQMLPTKDFVFSEHNIYEVVYYSYSNYYGKYANKPGIRDLVIFSYFLKSADKITEDLASAKRAFSYETNLRRFANKVDVEKDAIDTKAQIVAVVLSLNYNDIKQVCVQVDLYNDSRAAQEAYAQDNNAFMVGLYNGSRLIPLTGKIKPVKDRASILSYWVNKPAASDKVELVLNWLSELIDGTTYDLPTATDKDILDIIAEAIEKAERAYIKANTNRARNKDGSDFIPPSSYMYRTKDTTKLLASVKVE